VMVGTAVTCHAGPSDNLALFGAVHAARKGDVLVAATDAYVGAAITGDLLLGMARNRGVVGLVTDGLVRDLVGILDVDIPVYCAGLTANSPARNGPGTVGMPVVLGGVKVESGDIVLLRTGQMQLLRGGDKWGYAISTAGPSLQTVEWFHSREVAAVATDNLSFEVFPGEVDGLVLPVHMLHIVEMGLTQGQNFDLEDLAADCAADGRYAFLLIAAPEPFVAACGSPVVPVAVK